MKCWCMPVLQSVHLRFSLSRSPSTAANDVYLRASAARPSTKLAWVMAARTGLGQEHDEAAEAVGVAVRQQPAGRARAELLQRRLFRGRRQAQPILRPPCSISKGPYTDSLSTMMLPWTGRKVIPRKQEAVRILCDEPTSA